MIKAISKWFKNRSLEVVRPNVERLIKEVAFTSLPLEKTPTYGLEERLVCFHIDGVPVLGEEGIVKQLGCKYHNLERIPVFQQHLPLFLTMHTEGNPSYKFYTLEKEDINSIGAGLVKFTNVLWVGVYHREHWLQIWEHHVGALNVARTIAYWYPNATEEEIEASRF